MFQSFEVRSRPEDGPPRLAALRTAMAETGLQGFLVPRADAWQGEYVAACDERLAWLTGFTGSAGFCAVLPDIAGLFVDGRYRVQARAQVDLDAFTPVDWPEVKLAAWLKEHAADGAAVGFDPWLHTIEEIDKLRRALEGSGITLVEGGNLVDAIWDDRPAPPSGRAEPWPDALAGRSADDKRALVAGVLAQDGQKAAVLTLPDSLSWLLNIRGSDLPRIPVVQAFGIVRDDGQVMVFADPAKFEGLDPGPEVRVAAPETFEALLAELDGPVRVDRSSAPLAVALALAAGGVGTVEGRDPCILPKAAKTPAEIAGAVAAHDRDGAAMARFLHWLDGAAADLVGGERETLTEIEAVTALERFRAGTGALRDISFETIAGAGPHGAIVHYRVSEATNRAVLPGELLLVDSGGQYQDGTTDVTRTVAIGTPGDEERAAFTEVLRGMIAISRARWPKGLAGRDLDALARQFLWASGRDYDHGTGHGVGAYLSVHEGPQRLSRMSGEPLVPGMILSNEPGYYREDGFGIRIENLVVVEEAAPVPGGDPHRALHGFLTLTHVPIDLRLVNADTLSAAERDWLNAYHAETRRRLSPLVPAEVRDWLGIATRPI